MSDFVCTVQFWWTWMFIYVCVCLSVCDYVLRVLCLTCCDCLFSAHVRACVQMCVWVLFCVVYVYVYVCVCILLYLCTCVYMCTCVFVCHRVCMATCYSDADLFVRSETGNRKLRPDLDLCSLWTRYTGDSKNWPMGWSGDPYRFVQWRPDGDSFLKPHHFMWVFVYWSISVYFNFNILSYWFTQTYILFCIILFMTMLT